jgi:hypothetical protein
MDWFAIAEGLHTGSSCGFVKSTSWEGLMGAVKENQRWTAVEVKPDFTQQLLQ